MVTTTQSYFSKTPRRYLQEGRQGNIHNRLKLQIFATLAFSRPGGGYILIMRSFLDTKLW